MLARAQRALGHPADRRLEVAAARGQVLGPHEHLAAADVEVVRELHASPSRAARPPRAGRRASRRRAPSCASPTGSDDDLVAGAQRAAGDLAGVAALAPRGLLGPDHPLDRQPQRARAAVGGDVDLLEVRRAAAARRTSRPRRARRRCRRAARRSGRRCASSTPSCSASSANSASIVAEAVLVPVDEVHLVDRGDQVADARAARRAWRGGATARRSRGGRRSGSPRGAPSRRR